MPGNGKRAEVIFLIEIELTSQSYIVDSFASYHIKTKTVIFDRNMTRQKGASIINY